MLGESARDLYVPQEDWTEDLLEGHEEFLSKLGAMNIRVAQIVERVKRREELVQVRFYFGGGSSSVAALV